jgi:hypothetical protein
MRKRLRKKLARDDFQGRDRVRRWWKRQMRHASPQALIDAGRMIATSVGWLPIERLVDARFDPTLRAKRRRR